MQNFEARIKRTCSRALFLLFITSQLFECTVVQYIHYVLLEYVLYALVVLGVISNHVPFNPRESDSRTIRCSAESPGSGPP